jgi:H+/Cl- antiporter ClcA
MVQSALIGFLAIGLIVGLVGGLFYWRKKHITDTKKEKAKYIATAVLAVCMLTAIALFDMYQFWAM